MKHPLCLESRFLETDLEDYEDFHKKPISIEFLKDTVWRTVLEEKNLYSEVINSPRINVPEMTSREDRSMTFLIPVVGSILYTHTRTHPDICFAIGMLGRYQSNLGMAH